jgi:hypothetical protein
MLDKLTKETFLPHLDALFRLTSVEPALELRLVEVEARWGSGPRREPFSLIFLGPREPVLPQRIYRLEQEDLGPMELFLVPIGRDGSGTRYEAAFN